MRVKIDTQIIELMRVGKEPKYIYLGHEEWKEFVSDLEELSKDKSVEWLEYRNMLVFRVETDNHFNVC